jgi:hypothetical protein
MRFMLPINKMAVTIPTRDVRFEGMYIRSGSDFGTARLAASARPIRQVHVLGDGPPSNQRRYRNEGIELLTGRL